MIKVTEGDSFIVKCASCKRVLQKVSALLDFNEVSIDERNMGGEIEYEADYECDCSCGVTVTIVFKVWEYPEGAISTIDYESSNCEVTKLPSLSAELTS